MSGEEEWHRRRRCSRSGPSTSVKNILLLTEGSENPYQSDPLLPSGRDDPRPLYFTRVGLKSPECQSTVSVCGFGVFHMSVGSHRPRPTTVPCQHLWTSSKGLVPDAGIGSRRLSIRDPSVSREAISAVGDVRLGTTGSLGPSLHPVPVNDQPPGRGQSYFRRRVTTRKQFTDGRTVVPLTSA